MELAERFKTPRKDLQQNHNIEQNNRHPEQRTTRFRSHSIPMGWRWSGWMLASFAMVTFSRFHSFILSTSLAFPTNTGHHRPGDASQGHRKRHMLFRVRSFQFFSKTIKIIVLQLLNHRIYNIDKLGHQTARGFFRLNPISKHNVQTQQKLLGVRPWDDGTF